MQHYASPYYDPVKAHEYYLRTRKLKDRRSTANLNEEGKTAARYVREQLSNERKQKVESHREQTVLKIDSLREQKNAKIESHKNAMQAKIDDLRKMLKGMGKEEKARNKERIYSLIGSLREENKEMRRQLSEDFKYDSSSLRTDHKNERSRLKEEYDEKYIQELDKIRSESKFQKTSKRKSKK